MHSIAGIEENDDGLVILAKDEGGDRIWLVKLTSLGEFITTAREENLENNMRIYPNPTSDKLWISTLSPIGRIEILDFKGNLVLVRSEGLDTEETIDVDSLIDGSYLVRIFDRSSKLMGQSKFIFISN